MITDWNGVLEIVTDRNAIQVVGCRGDIVGHLSMPSSLTQALMTE